MYSSVATAIINGIDTIPIHVEVDIRNGMPVFDMVGYLSAEVKEAKERVKTALYNCGIILPPKRITINLSPGNIRKNGTGFDLPIAVAVLSSLGLIKIERYQEALFVGELGLNGSILPINGVLPIISDGMANGIKNFVIPKGNDTEASLVKDVNVFSFNHLKEVIAFLNGKEYCKEEALSDNVQKNVSAIDFSDINGQFFLKRACEVATAGMHNLLMVGPPGAGKTMISERVATILPPLSEKEKIELSKIYSVCGLLNNYKALIQERPFRNPHHTISKVGLIGGGQRPRPGEMSLAHNGVLFLDEFTEFSKSAIETLRQPMEEKRVTIIRNNIEVEYPADFLLLVAMNPCNCGYYPDRQKCRCSSSTINRYYDKIPQPILDRIDICVEAPKLNYQELVEDKGNESSETIRERIVECHKIQRQRFQEEDFLYNSKIPVGKLTRYCRLGEKESNYMENIYSKMALTARTYHKILRVARTIADLDKENDIKLKHLNEAICYRSINEQFWRGMP